MNNEITPPPDFKAFAVCFATFAFGLFLIAAAVKVLFW